MGYKHKEYKIMRDLNLMPWREIEKIRNFKYVINIIIINTIVVIFYILILNYYYKINYTKYLTKLISLKNQNILIEKKLSKLRYINKNYINFQKKWNEIKPISVDIEFRRILFLLKKIIDLLPKNVILTKIELANNKIILTGTVPNPKTSTLVMDLLSKLSEVNKISLPTLISHDNHHVFSIFFEIKHAK